MGIPVARILGFEIRVQLAWILPLALIGVLAVDPIQQSSGGIDSAVAWALAALVAAAFFVSSLVHDLVHAVVARSRGVPVPTIVVSFFVNNGSAFDPTAPDPSDDLAIAASAPLANLVIAAVSGVLATVTASAGGDVSLLAFPLAALFVLNGLLGGINLVPAYPLDGGRIVRAIAWRRTGSEKVGWGVAAATGRATGLVAIGVGIAITLFESTNIGLVTVLAGWFIMLSARTIKDRLRVDELIGDLHVRDAMEPSTVTVHPSLTLDTFASQLLDPAAGTPAVPVTEDDAVVGIVGLRQINRLRRNRWAETRVSDVMVKPPRLTLVSPDLSLHDAVAALQRANVDALPVVEEGRLTGVLTRPGVGKIVSDRMAKAGAGTPKAGPRRRL